MTLELVAKAVTGTVDVEKQAAFNSGVGGGGNLEGLKFGE